MWFCAVCKKEQSVDIALMLNLMTNPHLRGRITVPIKQSLPFTPSSDGKCESISLPVNRPWKGLFPPAVFGCCCPFSLSLALSAQTKSLYVFLQALTHWGQHRHYSAILLIQYGAPTESTFHCNINFLVSIRSQLSPQIMLKIFSARTANRGRRTLCSFYHVKQPHPLCLRLRVTRDIGEMQERANRE